jgi:DNA repair protein RAD5
MLNPTWRAGEISLDFPKASTRCRGGILADEMGLGKTIMVASL